jgi:hypothetical protein
MSAKFTLTSGKEFTLALNYAKARQIRESLQLDFVDLPGVCDVFAKIDTSKDLLCQVLWALVRSQCEGFTEERFHEGFDGDTFGAARKALVECAVNFSAPDERDRLTRALELQTKMLNEMLSLKVETLTEPTTG